MPPMEAWRLNLCCFRNTSVLACRAPGTGRTNLVFTLYSSLEPHRAASCHLPTTASTARLTPLPVYPPALIPCSAFLGALESVLQASAEPQVAGVP